MSRSKGDVQQQEISRVRNPDTDYITVIYDLWVGDREDPAVGVYRYIGVWMLDGVPESEVKVRRSYGMDYRLEDASESKNLLWNNLGTVKEADKDALKHQSSEEYLLPEEGERAYRYGSQKRDGELYQAFLEAIDVLATDDANEEAWKAIDQWRRQHAMAHEK